MLEAEEDHAGGVRRRDRDAGRAGDHRAEHRLPDRRRVAPSSATTSRRSSRTSTTTRRRPTSTRVPELLAAGRPADLHDARPRAPEPGRSRDRRERAVLRLATSTSARSRSRSQPGTGKILAMAQNKKYSQDPDVHRRPDPAYIVGQLQHRLRVRRLERPPARIDVQGLHARRVAELRATRCSSRSTAPAARSRRSPTAARATGAGTSTRATTTAASRTTPSTPPSGR